jgi:HSP20 family protein
MTFTIFNDLYRLNREMNRLLSTGKTGFEYWPEVNIYSNENEYMVAAKIPGIDKNDVTISFKDNSLKITGEKKANESQDNNYHLKERKSGKFERNFLLDERVEADRISAEINNGILLVKVPKSPESKPVKIEIK